MPHVAVKFFSLSSTRQSASLRAGDVPFPGCETGYMAKERGKQGDAATRTTHGHGLPGMRGLQTGSSRPPAETVQFYAQERKNRRLRDHLGGDLTAAEKGRERKALADLRVRDSELQYLFCTFSVQCLFQSRLPSSKVAVGRPKKAAPSQGSSEKKKGGQGDNRAATSFPSERGSLAPASTLLSQSWTFRKERKISKPDAPNSASLTTPPSLVSALGTPGAVWSRARLETVS